MEVIICRSPLRHICSIISRLRIDSAGLTAREGDPADSVYVDMAQTLGLDLTHHRSKPVNHDLMTEADLILVMTGGHKRRLSERYPQFSGKIMLLGYWIDGGIPISDPHRKSVDAYRQVFKQIRDACDRWAAKL